MNVREYWNKRERLLSQLPEGSVVIISEATPDGGRAGLRSEVNRRVAAQLITEGRARAATTAETTEFRREKNAPQRSSKR